MPMPMPMPMPQNSPSLNGRSMGFHWGTDVIFYTAHWPSDRLRKYCFSLIAVFVICMVREWLSRHRRSFGNKLPSMAGGAVETVLHALHEGTGYLLMLAVMSYNLGVFLVVLAGTALGFYVFRGRHAMASSTEPSLSQNTDGMNKP